MREMTNNEDSRNTPSRTDDKLTAAHEKSDVSIRDLAKFGVALVALVVIANLSVWGAFTYFNTNAERAQPPPSPMFKGDQLPPEPRLQGAPGHQASALEDILEMRQREDKILGSYGWVDQQSGIVHIPIEDAKKLIVERGTAGGLVEAPQKAAKTGK